MKKFTLLILSAMLFTSCDEELISSAYDNNPSMEEVNDSITTVNTKNEEETVLYPIGFTVNVEDFK